MVLAVASIASLVMSAALFGRRSKQTIDDPPAPSGSEGRSVPSGPNVFSPDAAASLPDHPPAPSSPDPSRASEDVPADHSDSSPSPYPSPADAESVAGPDGRTEGPGDDGLIGGSLMADLEARAHDNDPAPHPLRPQEMWHPGVTPQTVGGPPPATEEHTDQEESGEAETAPSRFRFSRLRRVSPGEATERVEDPPSPEPPKAGPVDESVGDVLFGELFTSDRIPAGVEGLGSGAAPLVPKPDGAPGGLIKGPVRRNLRGSGRALAPLSDPHPQIADVAQPVVADQGAAEDSVADGMEELPVPDPVAPLEDPSPDPVEGREVTAVGDHDADPVVEPTVAAGQEPEPRRLAVDEAGLVDVGDASLRFDPNADATVTDDGDACSVALAEGWCWAALGQDARHLTIATDGTVLRCPPGTAVLVSVDDSGRFMVVVRGEAALAAGGRRIRLRSGAMAFLPHGSDEAQVDVATEAEITADPLVARNLALDVGR